MALGALAKFITKLTTQPFSSGLANRKKFNNQPATELSTAKVAGPDLGAFLSFEKGKIGLQALKDLDEADPSFSNGDDVRDFSLWLYDYSRWQWDLSEENEYGGKFPPAGGTAQYGDPRCQIRKVIPTVTGAAAGGKKVDLDIYGEGFLKGKTTIKILKASGELVQTKSKDPVQGSTFRGGLVQLSGVTLAPGNYRVAVDIDLGDGSMFTIDSPPSAAKFTVAA